VVPNLSPLCYKHHLHSQYVYNTCDSSLHVHAAIFDMAVRYGHKLFITSEHGANVINFNARVDEGVAWDCIIKLL
jgi:hypothetical protein